MCHLCGIYVSSMCHLCVTYVSSMCLPFVIYVSFSRHLCVIYVSSMCHLPTILMNPLNKSCLLSSSGQDLSNRFSKLCHLCVIYVSSMCHLCVVYVSSMWHLSVIHVSPTHEIDKPIKQIVSIAFQWAGLV